MLLMMVYAVGSSPHTRGARGRVHRHRRPVWIIPAYAGSTGFSSIRYSSAWDHPRIRGEHDVHVHLRNDIPGSSPHTRGAPWRGRSRCACFPDHPRIRGEHAPSRIRLGKSIGSSPHTRGAPGGVGGRRRRWRIIPAYAGSTSRWCARKPLAADHPRIRGEHWRTLRMLAMARGSSPHTRGARPQMFVDAIRGRIIPAYAGST